MSVERVPLGRLKPAPWNPRILRDSRFKQLCKSLQADPDFLELRPILATADGTIYGGNMRWRAAEHLGWETVPAIIADIPEQLAKERALRDNNSWGEWQEQELSEILAELEIAESDLEALGFEPYKLNQLIGDGMDDPNAEWQGMPSFENQDQSAFRTIYVHFENEDAVAAFARLVDYAFTAQTKSIWYPKRERRKNGVYVSDES